jgi:hypothetical protein
MGVTTSSRFRKDAEFLLLQTNGDRLKHLMAKQAHKIIDATSTYNILLRLCEEGHFAALLCAVELSRCVGVVYALCFRLLHALKAHHVSFAC